jgi:hypothetical protein
MLLVLLLLLSAEYRRSGVGGVVEVAGEDARPPRELLLELLVLLTRPGMEDEPGCGRGFAVLGGGGGATELVELVADFGSLFFDELFLLSFRSS